MLTVNMVPVGQVDMKTNLVEEFTHYVKLFLLFFVFCFLFVWFFFFFFCNAR